MVASAPMEQFEPKTLRRLLESGSLPVQACLILAGNSPMLSRRSTMPGAALGASLPQPC